MRERIISLQLSDVGGFAAYAARRFIRDNGLQLAGSLTYTTLLALIPSAVVALSVVAGFPWFAPMREQILQAIFTSLLPDTIESLRGEFDGFAANAGKLGFVALAGMAVTAVMTLAAIEGAFNTIWRVRDKRRLGNRLAIYWSILTLGPLLFGGSLSLSSYLFSVVRDAGFEGYAPAWVKSAALLPPLIAWIGFAWLYFTLPNRSVRPMHAFLGGLVATILFEGLKRGFAWYVRAFPSYQAIYGALAAVPILLVWTYLAWAVTLFGAAITASLPDWRHRARMGEGTSPGPAPLLAIALALLMAARRGAMAGEAVRRRDLMAASEAPPDVEDEVLECLARQRFLVRTPGDRWMLARDLASLTLYDLVAALGLAPFGGGETADEPWALPFRAIVERVDIAQREDMSITLDRLLAAVPQVPAEGPLQTGEPLPLPAAAVLEGDQNGKDEGTGIPTVAVAARDARD